MNYERILIIIWENYGGLIVSYFWAVTVFIYFLDMAPYIKSECPHNYDMNLSIG